MTTFSNVANRPIAAASKTERFSVYGLNYFLMVLAAFLLLSYIFLANLFVSQKYQLSADKKQLNNLAAEAITKEDAFLDLNELLLFAQNLGMVESKDTDFIVRDGNFALTPASPRLQPSLDSSRQNGRGESANY